MVANNISETVPGFVVQSHNFVLRFCAAYKKGMLNHKLEYETDWTKMIEMILDILEKFPNSVKATEDILEIGVGHGLSWGGKLQYNSSG